jgi:hypothetical protein
VKVCFKVRPHTVGGIGGLLPPPALLRRRLTTTRFRATNGTGDASDAEGFAIKGNEPNGLLRKLAEVSEDDTKAESDVLCLRPHAAVWPNKHGCKQRDDF